MTTTTQALDTRNLYVVHPLDDAPEQKCDPDRIGPMQMSATVKLSLLTLRGYLLVMIGLALYRLLSVCGVFGHPMP